LVWGLGNKTEGLDKCHLSWQRASIRLLRPNYSHNTKTPLQFELK